MKIDDYKCENCNKVIEFCISDTEWKDHGFPVWVCCPDCNGKSNRVISNTPSHVKIGRTGNYKNGYTSQQGYVKKT